MEETINFQNVRKRLLNDTASQTEMLEKSSTILLWKYQISLQIMLGGGGGGGWSRDSAL